MKISCIGGGTGLYTLLSGLKRIEEYELAAIVTMMDSGGSTGRLRDEFGYLPPGDIRRCLLALSNAPKELRMLMEHRFQAGEGLKGHSFGNLMLTALKDELSGSKEEKEYGAIQAMGRILDIKGSVYPVTLTDCHLKATLSDGTVIKGETNIDVPQHDASMDISRLELDPPAELFGKTRDALTRSRYIIIGPGDLYTSIMPNLIVDGMADAMQEAKANGARIIYVVNTMTKHGETDGFTAQQFTDEVQEALDGATIDAVLVNTGKISEQQREAYEKENASPVKNDLENGRVIIAADMVSRSEFARHEPGRLADAVQRAIGRLG